jgi:hypothetical protein
VVKYLGRFPSQQYLYPAVKVQVRDYNSRIVRACIENLMKAEESGNLIFRNL